MRGPLDNTFKEQLPGKGDANTVFLSKLGEVQLSYLTSPGAILAKI